MKKLKVLLLTFTLVTTQTLSAQIAINTDGSSPNSSAMLDIKSKDKGLLLPRMTTMQIKVISNPAAGLLVYNSDSSDFYGFNGNKWISLWNTSDTISRWSCGDPIAYGGQNYSTVQIGTQCWMAENLNIGTMITGSSTQTDNDTIEKYCYNDNTSNCDTYGGLYQWNEAMQYLITEGTQGICPSGWHIPTDAEWMMLEETLGMCSGTGTGCSGTTGFRGTDEASKLAGNEPLWTDGVLDQNVNFGTSGFTSLPSGYFNSSGTFALLTTETHFWTSKEISIYGWNRRLLYSIAMVGRTYSSKDYGFSIRCIRD